MRRGLLVRYLDAVGHVLDRLLEEREVELAPSTSLFLLVLFVSLAAFTNPLPLRACSFMPLVMAFSLATMSQGLRDFLKLLSLALVFPVVAALPLLFTTPGQVIWCLQLGQLKLAITWEGVWGALGFVLKCLNAVSMGLAWTRYVGFSRLLKGLHMLDPTGTLPNMAFLTARYVPLSIREAQRLLAAREARIVGASGTSTAWAILASCCGDLLLRSFSRAWRVGLAMRSRCLSGQPVRLTGLRECFRMSALDALWCLLALAYAGVYLLEVV